jgi:hypothetical protein
MLNRNNQGIPLGNNILSQSRKENSRNMKEGRGDRLVYMYTRPGSPNSPPSPRSGSAGTPPPQPGSVKSNFLYDEDPLNEIIRYMLTSDRNEHMSSTASLSQASSSTVAFDPSPYQIIKTMQLNKVMKILYLNLIQMNLSYYIISKKNKRLTRFCNLLVNLFHLYCLPI